MPVSRSQTATVLSSDPETMRRPSGLTATEFTAVLMPGEPVDLGAGFEVPDRHGLSWDPETMRRPSGLTATEFTPP